MKNVHLAVSVIEFIQTVLWHASGQKQRTQETIGLGLYLPISVLVTDLRRHLRDTGCMSSDSKQHFHYILTTVALAKIRHVLYKRTIIMRY